MALLGGLGTLVGYFISNSLERQRAARLREMEFRLDRYKEFLLAFNEDEPTHLRFANSINVILMIGGAGLLNAIKDLAENYNDEDGTAEKQQLILDRILFQMRCDLNAPDSRKLKKFRFPVLAPDVAQKKEGKSKTSLN